MAILGLWKSRQKILLANPCASFITIVQQFSCFGLKEKRKEDYNYYNIQTIILWKNYEKWYMTIIISIITKRKLNIKHTKIKTKQKSMKNPFCAWLTQYWYTYCNNRPSLHSSLYILLITKDRGCEIIVFECAQFFGENKFSVEIFLSFSLHVLKKF